MPKTAQPAETKVSASHAYDEGHNAISDARVMAKVLSDLLIEQSSDELTLSAEGLLVLMRQIEEKCEKADKALGDLLAAKQATPT